VEGYLFRGYLPPRHEFKAPYNHFILLKWLIITYNDHVIVIFCNLNSLLLGKVNLKVYAIQNWWEKAWQQKGIKKYIPLQKLSTKT
jgi:hypothetical protein